jgi:phospholipid/cholesterol/gamma-HCH transport system substrate-binding protein
MAGLSTEIKVGLFVLISFLLLIYMTATVGKWSFGKDKGYQVLVKLDSAAGLLKDTPVKVLGVTKGRVESLALDGNKAVVTMQLPRDFPLPEDSLVYVRSEGLLGERYIELKPGTPGRPAVKDGGELLQGAPPADIDQLFTELSDVAAGIKNLTQMITQPAGGGAGKAEQRGALQSIISNLEETSRSLNNVSQRLERGEGTLGKLLTDEAVYNQLKRTLADIGSAVEKISTSEGTLAKLMQDDEIYNQLREAIARINRILKKTEKGEGIAGKLFLDNKIYGDEKPKQAESAPGTAPEEDTSLPVSALGGMLGEITE